MSRCRRRCTRATALITNARCHDAGRPGKAFPVHLQDLLHGGCGDDSIRRYLLSRAYVPRMRPPALSGSKRVGGTDRALAIDTIPSRCCSRPLSWGSSCRPWVRGGWWPAATSGHSCDLPARGVPPIRAGRPVSGQSLRRRWVPSTRFWRGWVASRARAARTKPATITAITTTIPVTGVWSPCFSARLAIGCAKPNPIR